MSIHTASPLGITMGCPVGVGPEVICRVFATKDSTTDNCVVLGDLGVLRNTAALLGLDLAIIAWRPGETVLKNTLPVLSLSELDTPTLLWGRPDERTGKAMAAYIRQAVLLCQSGALAGMVTCPISKKTLNAAGFPYPGHTEMLAALTETPHFGMMMHGNRLTVVLVTIHESLAAVPALLTRKRIRDCISLTAKSLQRDFGIAQPRIAVAGCNPHCGEQGMFGLEEEECIAPAVQSCQGQWRVSGPWPPDTVFYRAAQGAFDAVVAMYHDQGLIPFKLLHFQDGVNVTLGLPIVRTSVDHGTAYDIAGKGLADPSSLKAACLTARRIADNRSKEARP